MSRVFSLDLRSLAAMRIGTAILIIFDLIIRAQDLVAFYTDSGVLPRHELADLMEKGIISPLSFSIHAFFGSWQYQTFLFFLAFAFALFLLVGYKTGLVSLVSWFLLLSLQRRNPILFQAGDQTLRLILFWGMFLPWGARFSLDSLSKRARQNEFLSAATFGYILQIAFVYLFASIFKLVPTWLSGRAIYYVLNIDQLALPFGQFLLNHPFATSALSYYVLGLEALGPFLLVFPLQTQVVRGLTVLALSLMHLGIAATLALGLFPWISIVSLVALLPGLFWQRLAKIRLWPLTPVMKLGLIRKRGYGFKIRKPVWRDLKTPLALNLFALAAIVYVFYWNYSTLFASEPRPSWPGYAFGLAQSWALFVPPYTDDGWYVIPGKFEDGKEVDLFRGGRVAFAKPENVRREFKNYRWQRYFRRLLEVRSEEISWYRPYAEYLCRTNRGLMSLEFIFINEEILDQGVRLEKVPLIEHTCQPGDNKTFNPEAQDWLAFRFKWAEKVVESGPRDAYEEFQRSYLAYPPEKIHLLAHLFGEVLYDKFGFSGIKYCDVSFQAGCYHGIFNRALVKYGEAVVNDFAAICEEQEFKSSCYHGVGHAILDFLGPEKLSQALLECQNLGWDGEFSGCGGGVLMEYFFPSGDSVSLRARDFEAEKPYLPCPDLPLEFQDACHFLLVEYWNFVFGYDYRKTQDLCLDITGKKFRETCLFSLGATVVLENDLSLARVEEICRMMPDLDSETLCRAGAAFTFRVSRDFEKEVAICSGSPGEGCFKESRRYKASGLKF